MQTFDNWLKKIGLSCYSAVLRENYIRKVEDVLLLKKNDFLEMDIKNAHRIVLQREARKKIDAETMPEKDNSKLPPTSFQTPKQERRYTSSSDETTPQPISSTKVSITPLNLALFFRVER